MEIASKNPQQTARIAVKVVRQVIAAVHRRMTFPASGRADPEFDELTISATQHPNGAGALGTCDHVAEAHGSSSAL
jgi:hypothetical protein